MALSVLATVWRRVAPHRSRRHRSSAKKPVRARRYCRWPASASTATGQIGARHDRCAACPGVRPPGYAVALRRALHGPFTGASPSPRGLGPQRVESGLAPISPYPSRPDAAPSSGPLRHTLSQSPLDPPRSHKQLRTRRGQISLSTPGSESVSVKVIERLPRDIDTNLSPSAYHSELDRGVARLNEWVKVLVDELSCVRHLDLSQ